jgi:two-component system, OmpR family, response regulator MprA
VRVLLIDDDLGLVANVRRGLEEAGFSVDVAADGVDGLNSAHLTPFDVVVLDAMLPGMDGFEVCRDLRRAGVQIPVIMLTARDAVEDRVRGLAAGADDYLVKPFAFVELLARIRALGRRHLPDRSAVFEAGGLRLDTDARRLTIDGLELELTAKEMSILEYFFHHPNRVLTRTQIEDHVWNYDYASESNLVEVYIGRLRRKLSSRGVDHLIETMRGTGGYRLNPPSF